MSDAQLFALESVEYAPVDAGPIPSGPYDVVYADPPWRYMAATTTPGRRIEDQYDTLPLEDICALPVPASVAVDGVLFMWATAPLLPDCLAVVGAWGFTYKTCMVWDKERMGLGHWVRVQHELLLLGTRGKPSLPVRKDVRSVMRESSTVHSAKPERAYDLIESMFPKARRLELFARRRRAGWDAWGNQA